LRFRYCPGWLPAAVHLRPGDALQHEAAVRVVGIQGAHHRDLVTHVKTCLAMQQDMMGTAKIHERLAAKELLPVEHFVDSAYADAALLVSS